MKNICFYLLLLAILPLSSASAQVVSTVSGYPVIDLSALKPLGVVLTYPEAVARLNEMYATTPTYDTAADGSYENQSWNRKLSMKYQLMRANCATSKSWVDAWNLCKSYAGEGGAKGSWRLPTQRELQMIFVLHPQLIGKAQFTALQGFYWVNTIWSGIAAYTVSFNYGSSEYSTKKSLANVRCVRDL